MTPAQARAKLWRLGELRFLLWDQQLPIYDDIQRLTTSIDTAVVLCARQFGKSVLGTLLAVEDCLRNPNVLVMIIGPEVAQTGDIVKPRIKMLTKDAPEGLIHFVKSERCWYFSNGSELRYSGFDGGTINTRGKTIYKIYLEEVGFSHPDKYNDFIQSDLVPALTHSPDAKIFYLTTLPKVEDHPFVTETIPYAKTQGYFKSYTIEDNAAISDVQKAKLIRMGGGPDSPFVRREYYNEIIRDPTVLIVPEFDEKIHVVQFELPEYFHAWTSGDFGGTRDKHVMHLNAELFDKDIMVVYDERWFENHTPTSTIVTGVKDMERPWLNHITKRWVDASGQTQVDMAMDHNYETAIPRKTEDMEAGVRAIRTAYTNRKIIIHPRCQFTITTLRSGTWNKTRTDFERTKALGHADAIASHVYGWRHRDTENPYPTNHGFHMDEMVRQGGINEGHALKALIPGFK